MPKNQVIDETTKHQRLDLLLTAQFPELSRAYIQKLIEEGKVLVNKEIEKPGYRLRLGDKLRIDINLEELQTIPDIDLPVIYEDKDVIVIDKPVGVISHSRGKYWYEPSVASFIRQKDISKHDSDFAGSGIASERAGIVHRLDRATSGVMVCAKNSAVLSLLQKQFSQRSVKKTYVAIVAGHLKEQQAIIDMPIDRSATQPQIFRVSSKGKPARTEYKVIKSLNEHDVVELKPLTGRTHQLRVHLKQIGHPIVGDTLYGGELAERLYLHAKSLEIILPNGKHKTFVAPLPKEFKIFEKSDA